METKHRWRKSETAREDFCPKCGTTRETRSFMQAGKRIHTTTYRTPAGELVHIAPECNSPAHDSTTQLELFGGRR